ncbi:MAG: hypothetical protein ABSG73_00870 [Candidatus Aminicenantales bacterium]|jgi:hypothetical protein
MDIQDELRRHLRTLSLIGVSIVTSLLIYLGLEEFIRARFKPFYGFAGIADRQPLRYGFFALAAVALALILVLRQALLKKTPRDDRKTALHRLERATLLTLVLAEVPALLGLVLFILGGLKADFYILLATSILLVIMFFPRRSGWEEWLS